MQTAQDAGHASRTFAPCDGSLQPPKAKSSEHEAGKSPIVKPVLAWSRQGLDIPAGSVGPCSPSAAAERERERGVQTLA